MNHSILFFLFATMCVVCVIGRAPVLHYPLAFPSPFPTEKNMKLCFAPFPTFFLAEEVHADLTVGCVNICVDAIRSIASEKYDPNWCEQSCYDLYRRID